MYTKLFAKILDSSIWLAPDPHRLVWITLLAAMDEDCNAFFACSENLAGRARVTLQATEAAILAFESPDPKSGDPEFDGRRIERIPGGWHILNGPKYREIVTKSIAREKTRERVQRWREKQKEAVTTSNGAVTKSNASEEHSISEENSKEEKKNPPYPPGGGLAPGVTRVFEHWKLAHQHPRAQLDKKRERVILAALKTYREADLCEAISGYLNSPHHMGENERNTRYDAIELMLRDAKHIDAGLQFARAPPSARSSVTDHNVRALTEWMDSKHEPDRHAEILDADGPNGGGIRQARLPAAR